MSEMNWATFWLGGISKRFGGVPCSYSWRKPCDEGKTISCLIQIYIARRLLTSVYAIHIHAVENDNRYVLCYQYCQLEGRAMPSNLVHLFDNE